MVVYRVETEDGMGAYRAYAASWAHCSDNHPDPVRDGIFKDYEEKNRCEDYYYGFFNLYDCINWFFLDWLQSWYILDTVYVYAYEVDDALVKRGETHLAFRRDMNQRQHQVDLEVLVDLH